MKNYVYVAELLPENTGYSVVFPDVPDCFTCGDNLAHAIKMAEDALALWLMDLEDEHEAIPEAKTDIKQAQMNTEGIATLIMVDTEAYRRKLNKKSVKKTLSIPQWMNEAAEAKGINFSQTLQDALAAKLQTV